MEPKYTGPDAILAESVYDSGYEDCEKVLNPKIEALQSELNKLKEYAQHKISCLFIGNTTPEGNKSLCDCGFAELDTLLDTSPEQKDK